MKKIVYNIGHICNIKIEIHTVVDRQVLFDSPDEEFPKYTSKI